MAANTALSHRRRCKATTCKSMLSALLCCFAFLLSHGDIPSVTATATATVSSTTSVAAVTPAVSTAITSSTTVPSVSTVGGVADNGDGEGGGKKNPIVALAGFVKDQVVRMKDGTVELYTNYQKCNDIRSKQKLFAERVGQDRRTPTTGGITYQEFDFLQRGRDDRGKLGSLMFMMFFAPNFVPYAIMFNPGMMPSPFKVPPRKTGAKEETRWEAISRQRTHAVLAAMLDVEKSARVAPALAKMNPFGGGKTRRNMERIDRMGHTGGTLLAANGADGAQGGTNVLEVLSDRLYKRGDTPFTKKETQLVSVPKPIIKGLASAIQAESPPSGLLPNFLLRGQVINHIQKVATADEFLVEQGIDLTTIGGDLLLDACNVRCIGGPGRSDDELRQGLRQWLDAVVVQPSVKSEGRDDVHYNPNLARAALMGYNAVDGARDSRSASYLPRLLFQGQYGGQLMARYEEEASKKKRRRNKK